MSQRFVNALSGRLSGLRRTNASEHALKIGTKPWRYLLILHEQVTEDKRLADLAL